MAADRIFFLTALMAARGCDYGTEGTPQPIYLERGGLPIVTARLHRAHARIAETPNK
jgi:hypothetical protein